MVEIVGALAAMLRGYLVGPASEPEGGGSGSHGVVEILGQFPAGRRARNQAVLREFFKQARGAGSQHRG